MDAMGKRPIDDEPVGGLTMGGYRQVAHAGSLPALERFIS